MYDLVIIGSGPAGLSAAVYAKRACLSVLVIEKEAFAGGQMVYTEEVDNYLGLNAKSGFELAESFKQHALDLDVSFAEGAVEKIVPKDGKWSLHMESGEDIETKTVLLATGATHRKLGVPGEETFAGVEVQMRCERYSATRGKEGYRKHVNLFERTICDPDSAGSGNSRQRRGNQCQDDRGASGIIRKRYGTDFKCSAEGRICCQYPRLPRRLSSDQEAGELYDRQDSPHGRRTAHSCDAAGGYPGAPGGACGQ